MSTPTPRAPRLSPSDAARVTEGTALDVEIAGRVLLVRGLSLVIGDAFAELNVDLAHDAGHDSGLALGDLVVLAGTLTAGALRAARLVEQSRPARPMPARETERLHAQGVGRGLLARAATLRAVRAFFDARGYLEVQTPIVVPSPGLDLHLDAFEVPGDGGGYLITSPEYQMKRLLAGGVPRCFQVAHCFRKGEVGQRHNPEFTMLEWYRAFASVDEVIADTEALVRHVAEALGAGPAVTIEGATVDLGAPFERLAVADAFARWAGVPAEDAIALATRDEDRFFRLLVDAVEPALAGAPRPVFLVDYPAPFASLARLSARDPRVAERFELYVAGVELCNGFGELTDAAEQRARLIRDQDQRRRRGLPVYPIDERFLAALEEGMPPSAGNALGLDRLIAICLGGASIGAVSAFPVGWL